MRILITGGTGFVGSHLANALVTQGHEVHILGRNFKASNPMAIPLKVDLRERSAVVAACAGMDAVYHAGALSAPWGQREDFFRINVDATRYVLEGCRAHSVSRIIYVSSPSVVFDGRDQVSLTECAPYATHFLSTYSLTKKLGEDLVASAAAQGLPAIILRPKAIFGPGDRSLLPRLVEVARRGRLPQIGDGTNLVDLTFIDNVVHALLLALKTDSALGKIYHITNDEHVPLWTVIRRLLERLGLPSRLRILPVSVAMTAARLMEWRAHLTGAEPPMTRYSTAILARTQTYNIEAAHRDLGYAPLVSVGDGIERTLASLQPAMS